MFTPSALPIFILDLSLTVPFLSTEPIFILLASLTVPSLSTEPIFMFDLSLIVLPSMLPIFILLASLITPLSKQPIFMFEALRIVPSDSIFPMVILFLSLHVCAKPTTVMQNSKSSNTAILLNISYAIKYGTKLLIFPHIHFKWLLFLCLFVNPVAGFSLF